VFVRKQAFLLAEDDCLRWAFVRSRFSSLISQELAWASGCVCFGIKQRAGPKIGDYQQNVLLFLP
jgi:hypothetical protein